MDWWPRRKKTAQAERAARRPERTKAAPLFGELTDALDELYDAAAKRRAAWMMQARIAVVPDGSMGAFLPAVIRIALAASNRHGVPRASADDTHPLDETGKVSFATAGRSVTRITSSEARPGL